MKLGRIIALFAAAASVSAVGCSNEEDTVDARESVPSVEAFHIADTQRPQVTGDVKDAALSYVRNYDGELGLSSLDDFEVRQVHQGSGQQLHVRMRQVHNGLPVWGSGIVVHASADNRFLGMSGTLVKGLKVVAPTASISAQNAVAVGKSAYSAGLGKSAVAGLAYSRETTELVAYPGKQSTRAAWHVVFFTELQAGIKPGLWNYFVDAATGDILYQFNGIDSLDQASGPGGNPKVSRQWVDQLDVEPSGGQFAMNTARLVTTNMNGGTSGTGTIVTGPLNPIGDAPINDAHGFAEQTLNMMQEWYGHNSIDDNGFQILSRVHYSVNYENAFWDGQQMTYGDGASLFFPLSGDIDVVGHEINHGFTTFHSNLIYASQSGGMNESFSDIAGTITEFFNEGDAADFDLGRDIFQQDAALRFMCDPTADGASIDNIADYFEGLDVHFSSGIMNKAFCRTAKRLASGDPDGVATQASVRRAGEAWYEANASFWTEGSTFDQGCQGVVAAATALGFSADELAAIDQSWEDVGITCDGGGPNPGGSCEGRCGTFDPNASCQCDDQCTQFGDCCGDIEQVCGGGPVDPASCVQNNACGGQAPAGCFCDTACQQFGDCCPDGPC
ncbi:MAG TPA: M4 family metallopeptidase [Kofleriaceae bacterium]|nr:M4 family metallopeptidase [Kofleriaceae bacterium]